jgi:hypothetical protein
LEEYLQELAGLSPSSGISETGITVPPNEQRQGYSSKDEVPNFAHAALILQNSSHIYSRKVEYLHTLVYKALQEFFQSTAIANNTNARRRKSADSDVDAFYEFDPYENFLLLDDVIPQDITQRKINLKDDDETADDYNKKGGEEEEETPFSTRGSNRSFYSATSKNNKSRLSLSGLSTTTLHRNSLGGRPSSSGALQQQRALLGFLNHGSLRLIDGQCDVDDSGALLMPGSQTNHNNDNLDGGSAGRESLDDFASGKPRNLFEIDSDHTKNNGTKTGTWDDFYDDDDNNDGPGFVMNDDMDRDEAPTVDLTPRDEVSKKVAFVEENIKEKKSKNAKNDPWKLLDPHSIDDLSYMPKPFKKGKTFRLPDGISQRPSECVTGVRTSQITKPQIRSLHFPKARPSLAVESFRVAKGVQLESRVKITNLGLLYGSEFMYVAKENAKLKAIRRRQERKREQEKVGKADQPLDPEWNVGNDYDDFDHDFGETNGFTGVDEDYDEDDDNDGGNAGFNSVDDALRGTHNEGGDGTRTDLLYASSSLYLRFSFAF